MSLFEAANAVKTAVGGSQAIHRTTVDVARVEELANLIEASYPGMELNTNAIAKGGTTATGERVVVFACKRRTPTSAAVTVYYNGTVVWAGIDPVHLN